MQLLSLCAALLVLAAAAVSAESVRETETMDPERYREDHFGSGDLLDDEDISELTSVMSSEEDDDFSGSGDEEDYSDVKDVLPSEGPMISTEDNHIPEDNGEGTQGVNENQVRENEIAHGRRFPAHESDPSNKIAMASTGNNSLFERTEVLAALIAGGTVGLLFAVFLILLLVYRMKKKDEGSYDLGKKPIYKKAPTNEFYA